ncbi:MAG: TatD family hydrolase [Oligosphaeraceae bacterium]
MWSTSPSPISSGGAALPAAFADSHLHLPLEGWGQWREAGLVSCVVCAEPPRWRECLTACEDAGEGAIPALGVHPWHLEEFSQEETLARLEAHLLACPRAVLGETGLDGMPGRPLLARQLSWFRAQLALASRLQRVAVLHVVRSWEALWPCLDAFPQVRLAVHGFRGGVSEAARLLRRPGAYLSLGFSLLRAGRRFQAVVRSLPRERLLVESDAPFGGHSPRELPLLVSHLAALRGEEPGTLARSLVENHRLLFPAGKDA